MSEPITGRVSSCPRCGHKPHREVCLNMASDNDCACAEGRTPSDGHTYEPKVWNDQESRCKVCDGWRGQHVAGGPAPLTSCV